MILTPTYHVMEMYSVHQDATFIPLTIKTQDYELGKDKLPAISASASIDSIGKVHITLANIDMNKEQQVSVNVADYKLTNVKGRVLTSAKVQDYNSFEKPNKIKPAMYDGASLSGNTLSVKIPPFSVVVLELK